MKISTALILFFFFHLSVFGENKHVLFIGSSTMERWTTLAADFPSVQVTNLGMGGTQYPYLVEHAKAWAKSYPADEIVIYSGDNDIAENVDPKTIAENFQKTVSILHAQLPHAHITVISIKPSPDRWPKAKEIRAANKEIAEVASHFDFVSILNIFPKMLTATGEPQKELFLPDGVHMNQMGYEIWKNALANHWAEESLKSKIPSGLAAITYTVKPICEPPAL